MSDVLAERDPHTRIDGLERRLEGLEHNLDEIRADMRALHEAFIAANLGELRADMRELRNAFIDAQKETTRRIDRLLYSLLGGGAILTILAKLL